MAKLAPYLALFAGIVLALVALPATIETFLIASQVDDYQRAEALVLTQYEKEHARGPKTHVLEFELEIDGRTYKRDNRWTRHADTAEELRARIIERGNRKSVVVYYDPDDLHHVVVSREIPLWRPIVISLVTLVLLVGGISSIRSNRRLSRERRAEEERRKASREARLAREAEREAEAKARHDRGRPGDPGPEYPE